MSSPAYSIAQFPHRNPGASEALMLTYIIVPNTSPEDIVANIQSNTALPLEWLTFKLETERPAILVGGGPSAADHIDEILAMHAAGGVIFSMNGSARWLADNHGIIPDWQVIADAQEETASLVFPWAMGHLFSSAVNPKTMAAARAPVVWHPKLDGIEHCFPEHRKTAEYTLIGGTSAGTHAMCVAYALGHREFHCFGYDSSHRDGQGHAYSQPMNDTMPAVNVEWAGKSYLASIAMKAQAETFPITARAMQKLGCKINVHGDGLLPAIWNTSAENLSEKDKYRLMWQFDSYREYSPGEEVLPVFLHEMKPKNGDRILDFGCGTGRAALKLHQNGFDVVAIDFADNCRDHEAIVVPFVEWDLTQPLTFKGDVGLCTDVMEHIPGADVETVITNIMNACPDVFFQICTRPDTRGAMIGAVLHHTVKPHHWWTGIFRVLGFEVLSSLAGEDLSCFHIRRVEQ